MKEIFHINENLERYLKLHGKYSVMSPNDPIKNITDSKAKKYDKGKGNLQHQSQDDPRNQQASKIS